MRLIIDSNPIDFEEEVKVSMSIGELVTIYEALASCDTNDVCNCLNRFNELRSFANESKQSDFSYKTYEQVVEILKKKGISL